MSTYSHLSQRVVRIAMTVGPGLVVMFADADAGSLITAAQSGAEWGYRLLLLQMVLIPLLYMAQELSIRLALGTGKGYGELIRQRFGRGAAFLSLLTLMMSCFGALLTQMSGLAGAGQLLGVPIWQTIALVVVLIFTMMWTGSYRSVEKIAITFGLFGLAFLLVAWKAHPDLQQIGQQMQELPLHDHRFLYLIAANLGTSIMPWTLIYQQSALLDKGLGLSHLKIARTETVIGATLCQLVQAAVLVAAAASFGQRGVVLETVPQIADAFTAVLGQSVGHLVFVIGMTGSAMVATIVVCLTAAWSVGEVIGVRHSLEQHPREAPWFYVAFAVMLVAGGVLVCSGINLIHLSIATGVINALLLPVVLGFLYSLARTELPAALRLQGTYAIIVAVLFIVTAGVGLYAGIVGILTGVSQ